MDPPPLRRARPLADYYRSDVLINFENNQVAQLDGGNLDSSTSFLEDSRLWIRLPFQVITTLQLSVSTFGMHGKVLISFWALFLITYGVVWRPSAGFLISWAVLCLIGFLLSFGIKKASARLANGGTMLMLYASILPLLLQLTSASRSGTSFASSFLYGHLLANILLGPALMCLSNGLSRDFLAVACGNQLRCMMSFGLTGILGILVWVHLVTRKASAYTQAIKIALSIAALVFVIGLFSGTIIFRTRTHMNLWRPEQPERPDSDDQSEEGIQWTNADDGRRHYSSTLNDQIIIWFATGLAIPCSHAMMFALKDMNTGSHMSKDILSVIALPMLANTPVFLLGMQQAALMRLNIAFELNHAAGIEISYIMASIVLLKSITFNAQVPFESTPADLVFLGVASITSNCILRHHRLTYMDGAFCLGLYLIIALTILLAGDTNIVSF